MPRWRGFGCSAMVACKSRQGGDLLDVGSIFSPTSTTRWFIWCNSPYKI